MAVLLSGLILLRACWKGLYRKEASRLRFGLEGEVLRVTKSSWGGVAGKTKVELSSRSATDTTTTAEPRHTIGGNSRPGFVGAAAAAAARLGLPFHNDTSVVPMAHRGRSGLYMDEFCGMGWWHSAGSVKGISIGLFLLVPRLLAFFSSSSSSPSIVWFVLRSFCLSGFSSSLRPVSPNLVILLSSFLFLIFCSVSLFRLCSQGRLSHTMAWHKGGVVESGSVGWTSVWYLDGWLAGLVVVDVTSQKGASTRFLTCWSQVVPCLYLTALVTLCLNSENFCLQHESCLLLGRVRPVA